MVTVDKPTILKLNAQWQPVCFTNVKTAFPDMTTGALIGLHISWKQEDNGDYNFDEVDEMWAVDSWDAWCDLSIREYDEFVSTVNTKVRVPKIVVAPNFAKMPVVKTKMSKRAIFERDGYTCQYTGKQIDPARADELFNIDHVHPKSRGGGSHWENLVTSLKTVNGDKKNKTPKEAGLKLLKQPVEPQPKTLMQKVKEVAHIHGDKQHRIFLK